MTGKSAEERFRELLSTVDRQYIKEVISDLKELGFFEAPASTRFHLNYPGGLVEHSVNVCEVALRLRKIMIEMNPELAPRLEEESVIISALLHDVCKADIYRKVLKKRKNSFGLWEDHEAYDVNYENFPMGHGEKSVIMLLRMGLDLTDDECLAIRWHMTAWDLPFQSNDIKGNLNTAKDICPLLSLIQAADGLAAGLLEKTDEE